MDYFSKTYFESRHKFRLLVPEAGGALTRYEHPSARGPGGEPLTVDVGVFGHSPAPRVFFNINGIHGNESYSGGASQLQWMASMASMASGALPGLAHDVCVVMIHNLNPYGWVNDTQLNEDRVNLNRNFMDFEALPENDLIHLEIAEAIAITIPSLETVARALRKVEALADTFGESRFNAALLDGQYVAPRGLNYGGHEPVWSNTVLLELAGRHLSGAEKVALLDWHTGIGPFGEPYPIHTWSQASESWRFTEAMWGKAAVEAGAQGVVNRGASVGDAPAHALRGLAIKAVSEAAPHALFGGGAMEFGTAPWDVVEQAVILDQWLMFDAPKSHVDTWFWRLFVRNAFAPRDMEWQASVLAHAPAIYAGILEGLGRW